MLVFRWEGVCSGQCFLQSIKLHKNPADMHHGQKLVNPFQVPF